MRIINVLGYLDCDRWQIINCESRSNVIEHEFLCNEAAGSFRLFVFSTGEENREQQKEV